MYVSKAPSDFGSCKQGISCCYLKNANVSAVPSTLPGIISGAVKSNISSLKVKWSLQVSKGPQYTTSSPTLSDSKVFFGIGTVFFQYIAQTELLLGVKNERKSCGQSITAGRYRDLY